jgi:hypothetical protein
MSTVTNKELTCSYSKLQFLSFVLTKWALTLAPASSLG